MQFPPSLGETFSPRDLIQVLHRELRGPESEMKGFKGKQRNFRRLQEGGVLMCKNSLCNLPADVTEPRDVCPLTPNDGLVRGSVRPQGSFVALQVISFLFFFI